MNRDKLIDCNEYDTCFNTCESYASFIYELGTTILIPYINVQISDDNPLGIPVGELIDFSYLVIRNAGKISWNGTDRNESLIAGERKLQELASISQVEFFGFNRKDAGFEIKINFEQASFLVPELSKTSQKHWSPWETPNFRKNTDTTQIMDFFEGKNLPKEIEKEFGKHEASKVELFRSEPEEAQRIIKKW